jgi:hypothetical protein
MLPCGEKTSHHTATEAENHCKPKTELAPKAILWLPQNRFAHIKREKENTLRCG